MKNSKTNRILLGASLGCLIMFFWGAFSHLVLLVGVGFTPLPNENAVITILERSIPEQGLYFFPGKDFRNATAQQNTAWEEKFKTGATGILVYRPVGGNPFSPNKLVTQFMSHFLAALIVAFVVSLIVAKYWKRVMIITLLGGFACVAVSTIYWNWYEFPNSFFVAQCIDQVVGFFLAGLIIAKIVPQASN